MDIREQMELLRGVLAVAVADGQLRRSELGVIRSLAKRAGVDRAWLDEMVDAAERGASVESRMFRPILKNPAKAMTVMVGTAALDGEIAEKERSVLVEISLKMGLAPGEFGEVFAEGMAVASRLRNQGRAKGE